MALTAAIAMLAANATVAAPRRPANPRASAEPTTASVNVNAHPKRRNRLSRRAAAIAVTAPAANPPSRSAPRG